MHAPLRTSEHANILSGIRSIYQRLRAACIARESPACQNQVNAPADTVIHNPALS